MNSRVAMDPDAHPVHQTKRNRLTHGFFVLMKLSALKKITHSLDLQPLQLSANNLSVPDSETTKPVSQLVLTLNLSQRRLLTEHPSCNQYFQIGATKNFEVIRNTKIELKHMS